MNHRYVSDHLDYHYWAQERVFDAVDGLSAEQFTRDLGNSFPSVRDTLVHIHFAERVWYARWQGEPFPKVIEADFPDLDSVRKASGEHEARMRALLDQLGQAGINRALAYTSRLDNRDHRSYGWQMFQHVVNHGTYHRGQITMMLRQMDVEPVATDLMLFYWEREESGARGGG